MITLRTIYQRMLVPFGGSLDLVVYLSRMIFTPSKVEVEKLLDYVLVNKQIAVKKHDDTYLKFEWVASRKNDIITDQLAFLFSHIPNETDCDLFTGFSGNLLNKAKFLMDEAYPGNQVCRI